MLRWAFVLSSVVRERRPRGPLTHDSWNPLYLSPVRPVKPANAAQIVEALSAPRLTKYCAAEPVLDEALELYAWNAQVSAALMVPAHFAEVVTRNAVSEALTSVYGERWPWSSVFEFSLPSPHSPAYNPRRDLQSVRGKHPTTGKVIADLKFVFWQKMFTARHDGRVWRHPILSLFPNAAEGDPVKLRQRLYDDLEHIRRLRNRVAHHEPVIGRNLGDDLARMLELVAIRSAETGAWLNLIEQASSAIAARP
ncbi:MAG: hypothetical protein L0H26_07395 [Microlunatus sp.]|nr:hypothetical protein [Microlunatus sp.]